MKGSDDQTHDLSALNSKFNTRSGDYNSPVDREQKLWHGLLESTGGILQFSVRRAWWDSSFDDGSGAVHAAIVQSTSHLSREAYWIILAGRNHGLCCLSLSDLVWCSGILKNEVIWIWSLIPWTICLSEFMLEYVWTPRLQLIEDIGMERDCGIVRPAWQELFDHISQMQEGWPLVSKVGLKVTSSCAGVWKDTAKYVACRSIPTHCHSKL